MKKFLPVILLALVVFAAYAPAIRAGFVWDDTALIERDPFIRSPRLIAAGFEHFLFTDATASNFYRPVQRLTYALDYAAFGFRPTPYHIASIAWHLAAAIALFFFALELFKMLGVAARTGNTVAAGATIVWALHPVHSGAVAYISGRADSLAATFGFAGLWFALRAIDRERAAHWSFTIAAAVLFFLSALSKEMGLIFLALWLVILLARKDRKTLRGAAIAVSFVLVAYWSLRFPAERTPPPAHPPMPALVRPIVFARAVAEYAGLIILPVHLHMERDVETRPTGFNQASANAAAWRELQTLLGIILIGVFMFWLRRERRRDSGVFLLLVLTVVAYLPVSGLFGLNSTVAEHWLYLPSAFLFLACGFCLARFLRRSAISTDLLRPVVLCGLVVWVAFLGARTFTRSFDWKDQRTFLESTIAQGGDSARMLINLACLEMKEGRMDDARRHLRLALKKEPDQPLAILNLAAVAVKQNDFAAAHKLLEQAKEMPLVEAQAYELMAVLENKETGRANVLRMRLASRTGPPNWPIEKRYVNLLEEMGDRETAILELRQCLVTQWYRADTWQMLAVLLAKSGRGAEAAAAFGSAHLYDVHLGETVAL